MRTVTIAALTAFAFLVTAVPTVGAERAKVAHKPGAQATDISAATKTNKKKKRAHIRPPPMAGGSAPRGAFQNPNSGQGPGPAPSNRGK